MHVTVKIPYKHFSLHSYYLKATTKKCKIISKARYFKSTFRIPKKDPHYFQPHWALYGNNTLGFFI